MSFPEKKQRTREGQKQAEKKKGRQLTVYAYLYSTASLFPGISRCLEKVGQRGKQKLCACCKPPWLNQYLIRQPKSWTNKLLLHPFPFSCCALTPRVCGVQSTSQASWGLQKRNCLSWLNGHNSWKPACDPMGVATHHLRNTGFKEPLKAHKWNPCGWIENCLTVARDL